MAAGVKLLKGLAPLKDRVLSVSLGDREAMGVAPVSEFLTQLSRLQPPNIQPDWPPATDGGAKREAIELIRAHGAIAAGVLIAFDRMERGRGERSAVQELEQEFGIPVVAIATLDDLLGLLARRKDLAQQRRDVISYREQYGAAA